MPILINKEFGYLGILGPVKRMDRMMEELAEEGHQIPRDKIYSPIGLDIGANNPEEIAISICSEIIAHLQNRSGGFLRHRKGSIH